MEISPNAPGMKTGNPDKTQAEGTNPHCRNGRVEGTFGTSICVPSISPLCHQSNLVLVRPPPRDTLNSPEMVAKRNVLSPRMG